MVTFTVRAAPSQRTRCYPLFVVRTRPPSEFRLLLLLVDRLASQIAIMRWRCHAMQSELKAQNERSVASEKRAPAARCEQFSMPS
eukprot:scaffold485095_cov28-Prasinocladus_malaysianus.AAC.1